MSLIRSSILAFVFFAAGPVIAEAARINALGLSVSASSALQIMSTPDERPIVHILPERSSKRHGDREESAGFQFLLPAKSHELGAKSQSMAEWMLTRIAADDKATTESPNAEVNEPQRENTPKDEGIPGAIVALIFGVIGLLVVARRNLR